MRIAEAGLSWREGEVTALVKKAIFPIRPATDADAAGILECLGAAFGEYRAVYTAGAYLDTVLTPESLGVRLSKSTIFVALDGTQRVIGTVSCSQTDEEEGHVRGMAVRPEWRGGGVAQQLLERVEAELRERKCSRVSLDTTEPLRRAMRFYERNGYERTGRVADFFGMALIEYVKKL